MHMETQAKAAARLTGAEKAKAKEIIDQHAASDSKWCQVNEMNSQRRAVVSRGNALSLSLHRGMFLSSLLLRLGHPARAIREESILLSSSSRLEAVLVGRSVFIVLPHVFVPHWIEGAAFMHCL